MAVVDGIDHYQRKVDWEKHSRRTAEPESSWDETKNLSSDSRKDRRQISSSSDGSNGGTDKNSTTSRDSHRKRKLNLPSNESSKRRKRSESPVRSGKKRQISKDDGIDCNSGMSFAEALGTCTNRPVAGKKVKSVSQPLSVKNVKTEAGISTPSSSSSSGSRSSVNVKAEPPASSVSEPLSLLASNVKLEPLNVDSASELTEISLNYKPLPAHNTNPVNRKQEEFRALSDVIYAKPQRTKVYSGMKSGNTRVPTLCEEAIRVLIRNIDKLGYTGGIPRDILKPVLEQATPDQLFTVEYNNPYLIEDNDQLWQFHCNREFRTKKREEMETWRHMYQRCLEDREIKLKALTANIKKSIDKSVPVRSVKLAYVDKPPRNVLRQQAKFGTAKMTTSSSDLKKEMILSGSGNPAINIAVPPPPMSRRKPYLSSSGAEKKTVAPLMAKALRMLKGRQKR